MKGRILLLALYLLSGACGLVHEVVWTRELSLASGTTLFGTGVVLAAFMGGLGLGSIVVGRRIDRSADPVRVYAWLEAGIGLFALAVPWILAGLAPLQLELARHLAGHPLWADLVRGLVAFAVLLIPTTLLGGTIPTMARILVRRRDTVGRNVALLYAMNTLGAVGGVLAAGFVLIERLGPWRTSLSAAVVNLGIAALVLVFRPGAVRSAGAASLAAPPGPRPRRIGVLVSLVFAGSGLAAMAYEVVWTRALALETSDDARAFATMLAVFLLGLAAGDLCLMRACDRIRRPLVWLGGVQVALGLSVVAATRAHHSLAPRWGESSQALQLLQAAVVLLPAALLFGTCFPLVSRVVVLELGAVGRGIGGVHAANTAGGLVGALAAGFLLVPLLGVRGSLILLCALNLGLGATCWIAGTNGVRRVALGALALAVLALASASFPAELFGALGAPGAPLISHVDDGGADPPGR